MSNSLRTEQDSIVELSIFARVGLSRVEIHLEAISKLHFSGQDLVQEAINSWVIVFFVHHVEAGDHVRQRVCFNDSIQLRLNMAATKKFEAAANDLNSKQGESLLNLVLAVFESGKFLCQGNRVAIVIEKTAEDMSVFDHSDHFIDKVTADSIHNPLEKWFVVVQLERELELGLEIFPDSVVLSRIFGWEKAHLVSQILVKLFRVLPVLAKSIHLDEAFLLAAFG